MWQSIKQIRRIVNWKNYIEQSTNIVKSEFMILITAIGSRNVVGHLFGVGFEKSEVERREVSSPPTS
jgi:hypothetical protein